MEAREFLTTVRDRGNYFDRREAEQVIRAVLPVLAERLGADEAADVAAQLPADLRDPMTSGIGPAEPFGPDEFLSRVARALDASTETAKWDAGAVLSTLADALTGDQLQRLMTTLGPGYAILFGKPEFAMRRATAEPVPSR
jgi:uncharacterized protein (DUF2267 family)